VVAVEVALLEAALSPTQVAAVPTDLPREESTTHIREATIWATRMRRI
jgi:hypothetical protein